MKVKRIILRQFRNYEELDFSPTPGVNVLVGRNAQGKTNLLECLYLCSTGRSFRPVNERELLRVLQPVSTPIGSEKKDAAQTPPEENEYSPDQTAPWSLVRLDIEKMGAIYQIEFLIQQNKRHVIRINGTPIARIGDLMGTLSCVLISPEEMRILKDGPGERRRFMDILLSQLYPVYFFALQRYMQALRQRNALLRMPDKASAKNQAVLRAISEGMSQNGALVMQYRRYLAQEMESLAQKEQVYLTGGEQLNLVYQPNVVSSLLEGLENPEQYLSLDLRVKLSDLLLKELTSHLDAEMKRGMTLYGPHRDELGIFLGGQNARIYASQGQQRTILLSLKLAEIELHFRIHGETPVLLLDDVFSELDEERQRLLFSRTKQTQTFITTAQLHQLPLLEGSFFQVEQGTIRPVQKEGN